jgi:tetratricopeptide (TPR) repeat protein
MFGSAVNALKQVFARSGPPRLTDDELFHAFFEARDWPATTQLLDLYPHALFTDTAQAYLMAVREACMAKGMRFLIPIIDERRHLLALCRISGDSSPVADFPSHTRRQAFNAITEQEDEGNVAVELQLELVQGFLLSDGSPDRWNMLHERLLGHSGDRDDGAGPADQMLQLALLRHQRATFLHHELESYTEARQCYETSIQTCGQLSYSKGLCLNMHAAGVAYLEQDEEEAALELFTASIDYAKRCNYLPQIIQSQRLLGKRLLLAHREAEARSYLLGSLQLALAAYELDEAMACAAQVGAIGTRCDDEEMLMFAHKTMQDISERRQRKDLQ